MKNARLIALLLLVVTLGVSGYYFWQESHNGLPEGITSGNGRIEAVQVDIATKYAGRLDAVYVQEGDLVNKGQVVARMDTRQLDAALAQSQARLAEVRQTVDQALATIARTESDILLAEKQLARYKQLLNRKAISQADYDIAYNTLSVAKATLGANRAGLRTQEFAVKAVEAQVREIETQLSDAVLLAPTQGRVLYKLAETGEVLGAGGKVATLLDLSDIYMEIYLPSRDAADTAIGAEARVRFDSLPEFVEPARVSFVAPQAQFTPKQVETAKERDKLMFRVKVQLNPERFLPYLDHVKTGVRGVAYVKIDPTLEWPETLNKIYPLPVVEPKTPATDANSQVAE